jgi:hypothetical protein
MGVRQASPARHGLDVDLDHVGELIERRPRTRDRGPEVLTPNLRLLRKVGDLQGVLRAASPSTTAASTTTDLGLLDQDFTRSAREIGHRAAQAHYACAPSKNRRRRESTDDATASTTRSSAAPV